MHHLWECGVQQHIGTDSCIQIRHDGGIKKKKKKFRLNMAVHFHPLLSIDLEFGLRWQDELADGNVAKWEFFCYFFLLDQECVSVNKRDETSENDACRCPEQQTEVRAEIRCQYELMLLNNIRGQVLLLFFWLLNFAKNVICQSDTTRFFFPVLHKWPPPKCLLDLLFTIQRTHFLCR